MRAVFDNPKTVVTNRRGGTIEWNPTFAHVPVAYGFGVELCWPRRAKQKGAVENLVGWVKGSFFKVRRFHDLLVHHGPQRTLRAIERLPHKGGQNFRNAQAENAPNQFLENELVVAPTCAFFSPTG